MSLDPVSLESVLLQVRYDFLKAGISAGPVTQIRWSTRMTRTRGSCRRTPQGYEIRISRRIQDYPELVRQTAAHELLHTVEGCFDHGRQFRHLANRLQPYGYHIQRCYDPLGFENEGRYQFRCTKCGQLVVRDRKSRFTEHPELYVHKGCGGTFRAVCETVNQAKDREAD